MKNLIGYPLDYVIKVLHENDIKILDISYTKPQRQNPNYSEKRVVRLNLVPRDGANLLVAFFPDADRMLLGKQ